MLTTRIIMKFSFTGLLLCWLAGPGWAQDDLSPRAWQNDVETFDGRIMDDLRVELEGFDFPPSWRVYRDGILDGIRQERRVLHPTSYQIMRDLMLTLSQDFEGLVDNGDWNQAERYLYTKLDLITNILSLTLDDDGY